MKVFYEITWREFQDNHKQKVCEEISKRGEEYLLGVDEEEFVNYLTEKFHLEPLKILVETKHVFEPRKNKKHVENNYFGNTFEIEVWNCIVSYHFEGSGELFNVQPNQYYLTTYEISLNGKNNTLSFSFDIHKQDVNEFNNAHDFAFNCITKNMSGINAEITDWDMNKDIRKILSKEKEKAQSKNSFFAAINVNVNKDTTSVFTVPTIRKKDIPYVPVAPKKEFTADPSMSKKMYDDLLKVTYNFGKGLEKKTSTYRGKQEEDLRDLFVTILETRYEGITATGETFNKDGKTDILLKHSADGSNLFVGECKIWKGPVGYNNAINQIFDRYLSWRDSKVAIILFVPNNNFTNVLEAVKITTQAHQYYVRNNGQRGESSFSYVFHLPTDIDKHIYLEVMAFHFDKLK